jgi:hypothetical protein
MVNNELAPSDKELGESLFSLGAIEDILLVDTSPRKFASELAEFVAQSRKLLFLRQHFFARLDPRRLGRRHEAP